MRTFTFLNLEKKRAVKEATNHNPPITQNTESEGQDKDCKSAILVQFSTNIFYENLVNGHYWELLNIASIGQRLRPVIFMLVVI